MEVHETLNLDKLELDFVYNSISINVLLGDACFFLG